MKPLILILCLFSAVVGRASVLVDGTAATVAGVLVTVQDAYFYAALQRFREGQPYSPVREEGEALRKTVQKIAFEEMVAAELKSFKFDGGGRADADRLLREKKGKGREAAWREFLHRTGKNETEARERLIKSFNVEHFVQKKVETLTPVITEVELERYFKQNQAKFGGKSLDAVRADISFLLKKERMQKGLEEWVRFLKEKYGVMNYLGSLVQK